MSTDQRLARIDTNLARTAAARREAERHGNTALATVWADEVNRLLELRLAVEAGQVSMSSD